MLGDRCRIAYLEAPEEVRVRRTVEELGKSPDEVRALIAEKDTVKRGRGAEKVKEIADFVFDNASGNQTQNLHEFTSLLGL
jgi:cytidylate kinase